MPSVIGAYVNFSHLTPSQIGVMTSSEMLGILITSASSFLWLKLINYHKTVLVVLTLLLITNSLNMLFVIANWSAYALFVLRFIAGLETGIIYAIAVVVIGQQKNTERLFSSLVSCQIVYGSIGFSCITALSQYLGLASIYIFFNIFIMLALSACFLGNGFRQIHHVVSIQSQTLSSNTEKNFLLLKVVLAIALYYVVQGSVWAYIEPIGISLGLSSIQIGGILSVGFTLSFIGSLCSLNVYRKMGRSSTVWVTICLQIICLLTISYAPTGLWTAYLFAVATIVYQVLWSLIVPLMMALLCLSDNTKQYSAWSISAFKIGLIVGPLFAVALISLSGYEILINVSCIVLVISGLLLSNTLNKPLIKAAFQKQIDYQSV
ncbi:MFS transporter [Pseudoalteromonas haloplanktis]|uniref:MFS transporter n=2 Tax=Pseudoalteromonas haloplanktis TaxID=228 RepID=A0ABU1B6M2_PSEHA|nr:MFS transporter [Pseudoalteromonas haloplanktis]MDQ9090210.1 MFS transporter [Pseudoalteromonas haloplanktis]